MNPIARTWLSLIFLRVQLAHPPLDGLFERNGTLIPRAAQVPDMPAALVNIVGVGVSPPVQLLPTASRLSHLVDFMAIKGATVMSNS